ncbi:MAG: hypothetical protein A2V70_17470 [Planctomycetes bacterium RBG_13_63_9]|nr:MAG: hypothetical protein A2V70_17470 [Planctomycetes bacterium RBG_13_63_9]
MSEVGASGHGLIIVTGDAALEGSLQVRLAEGYSAADIQALGSPGTVVDTRRVIQGDIAVGTGVPTLPEYLGLDIFMDVGIGSGDVNVDAALLRALAGDTDGDRDVDFADFNNLANNYTGALAAGVGGKDWRQGDFNGDADVDFGDFNDLANHYTGAGVEYGPGKDAAPGREAAPTAPAARTSAKGSDTRPTRVRRVRSVDAVFEEAAAEDSESAGAGLAKMAWLYEFEQIGTVGRSPKTGRSIGRA